MSRRRSDQLPLQPIGRVKADPYVVSVISGQTVQRGDPPPYSNTMIAGSSPKENDNEYLELGSRPPTQPNGTKESEPTKQSKDGKSCTRCCAIIVAVVVICCMVAAAVAGGTVYLLPRLHDPSKATGEKDVCASGPCQNQGSCIELAAGGYLCQCTEGFDGLNCEQNTNECLSGPCQNGGTCVDIVNGYACQCSAGYYGLQCEHGGDECASLPCQNGATCVDYVNRYECRCKEGYQGAHCEQNTNECLSGPCQNGGTCVDIVNGYVCQCSAGYHGLLCEHDLDDCASLPCQNGATCVDYVNRYECRCKDGYQGDHCDQNLDDCASLPCQNGATCVDYVNRYECQCKDGYQGDHCDQNTNECASKPCLNGGTCDDVINGYTCRCTAEYKGLRCEQDTCAQLWHLYGGRCYRYFASAKTWFNANTYCKNQGAELVSVHTESENTFVNGLAGVPIWSGLSDFASENRFVWSDGSQLSYVKWHPGEPNNKDNEDCVEFNHNSFGLWNDSPCSNTKPFVCKI